MSYGLSIHDTSGQEILRYSEPIVALYSFLITTTSGSRYVRGSDDHADIMITGVGQSYSLNATPPAITIGNDDVVRWSAVSTYTTILPSICFLVFNK